MLLKTSIRAAQLVCFAAFVSSCASPELAYKLQEGPTTLDLYRSGGANDENSHMTTELKGELLEPIRYENYTRDAGNELDQLFHRLPNPRILIYVYPHLATSDNAPIPGYTTAINLYAKDEYALPHEVVQYSPGARRIN